MLHGHAAPLRWLIGIELARYRNLAKLSLTEASARTGYNRAKIGHLETGRQQQGAEEITRLLSDYGVEQARIERLISLAAREDESRWWAPWAAVVPDWLTTFVGLEALADREFVFEPVIIPGPLQTEDYATIVSAAPHVRPDHVERVVDFRMARAQLVTVPVRPLHLHAVVTEAALHLKVGSPDLRRAQFHHLITMAALPTVTIQVISAEDAVDAAGYGRFIMLDFEAVPSFSFVELLDGAVYLHEPDQVHTYKMETKRLERTALSPERSVELIESLITS